MGDIGKVTSKRISSQLTNDNCLLRQRRKHQCMVWYREQNPNRIPIHGLYFRLGYHLIVVRRDQIAFDPVACVCRLEADLSKMSAILGNSYINYINCF